jgi:carboxypeptidase C (cathepsin A)
MTDTPSPPNVPAPRRFETRHAGSFNGKHVAYRCIAGETHLLDAKDAPRAAIFAFSYLAEEAGPPEGRPVVFAFNGGPGSASMWLHMGAMGPRRIVVPSDGGIAAPAPYEVIDNPLCPLDIADLVFIDPPGTGYSRMVGEAKAEDGWGLEQDAEIVGAFIRAWLTAHRRWGSPRYMCGESYGTTRAVAVAGKLASGAGSMVFNGLGLISVVLDFHTVRFEPGNPLPDVCALPTLAATALHHGLADAGPGGEAAFIEAARVFAVNEYLPALVSGSRLSAERRAEVAAGLARFTGLSADWLGRTRLRIDPARYRREVLRGRGVSLGRFDTRYLGQDHDGAGEVPDNDPASYAVSAAYVSAMNDHLGRALGVEWERTYVNVNREVGQKWDWRGQQAEGTSRWPAAVNVAPVLGRAMRENPGLKVWMANGLYDLATPFFAAETTAAGNGIDAARIAMTYYPAGHMMYLHEPSLVALMADMRSWLAG